jgi:hypothetical protein
MARYVIANRRAGKFSAAAKADSRAEVATALATMPFATIIHDTDPDDPLARRVTVVEADPGAMATHRVGLPPDVIVEPEIIHYLEWVPPRDVVPFRRQGAAPAAVGEALFVIRVTGGGQPLPFATVKLYVRGFGSTMELTGQTDAAGQVPFRAPPGEFSPRGWDEWIAGEVGPNRKIRCRSGPFHDLSLMSCRDRWRFRGRYTQACHLDQAEAECGILPGLAEIEGGLLQTSLNGFRVQIGTQGQRDPCGGRHKRSRIGCAGLQGTSTLSGGRPDIHAGRRKINIRATGRPPVHVQDMIDGRNRNNPGIDGRIGWLGTRPVVACRRHDHDALGPRDGHGFLENLVRRTRQAQVDDPHATFGQGLDRGDQRRHVRSVGGTAIPIEGVDRHDLCLWHQTRVWLSGRPTRRAATAVP